MGKRLAVGLFVVGLCLCVGGAPADNEPAARNKRTVYLVKYGAAKDLAAALSKHFKGDADVQLLPDSPSNGLLISAAPPVFEEVVKVLEQLDRRPRPVSVEVYVAGVTPKKGEEDKELDARELTGPAKDVETRLRDLQKEGRLTGLRRVQLTALENQPSAVFMGDMEPFVMGSTVTAAGQVSRNITYRNTGISVRATPHITPEKAVLLDLVLEDARAVIPPDGIPLGEDQNRQPVRAPVFVTAKLESKVEVQPGQAVAAEGVKTTARSGHPQTVVIVVARVLDAGAGEAK